MKLNFKEIPFEEVFTTINDLKKDENYLRMQLPPDGSITVAVNFAKNTRFIKLSDFANNEERFKFVKLANHWSTIRETEDFFYGMTVFKNLEEYVESIGDGGYSLNNILEREDIYLTETEISDVTAKLTRNVLYMGENIILTESNESLVLELAILQRILMKVNEPVTVTGIKEYIKRFGSYGLNVAMFNIAQSKLNIVNVDFNITDTINNVQGLRWAFKTYGNVTLTMTEEELQSELMSLQEEMKQRSN
jgi:hypothetical protein